MRRAFLVLALLAAAVAPAKAKPEVFLKARSMQPGEMLLVVVTGHAAGAAPAGFFGGTALNFFRSKKGAYLALAGIDLGVSTGPRRMALELRDGKGKSQAWSRDFLVEPKDFPMRKLRVQGKFVAPKKKDSLRAEREAKRLDGIFAGVTAERFLAGNFQSPIPGAASARFGERRVFNGVPKAPHAGADLRAAAGIVVRAPAGGKVALADDLFYLGRTIVLDHGYGLYSYYGHLSEMAVKPGDLLARGDVIGKVGATGRVTGPHLHWAVKSGGARVDPFSLMSLDLSAWLGP
jgi:hypothetical protein